jgi:hypothetical protein
LDEKYFSTLVLHLLSSIYGLDSFEQVTPGTDFHKVIRKKVAILLNFKEHTRKIGASSRSSQPYANGSF